MNHNELCKKLQNDWLKTNKVTVIKTKEPTYGPFNGKERKTNLRKRKNMRKKILKQGLIARIF